MSSTLAASGTFSLTLQEKASSEVNLSKTMTVGCEEERAASRSELRLRGTEKQETGVVRQKLPPRSRASEAAFRAAEAPTDSEYPALAKALSKAVVRAPAAEECGSGQTVERKSTDFFEIGGGGGGCDDDEEESSRRRPAAADAVIAARLGGAGVAMRARETNRRALEVVLSIAAPAEVVSSCIEG